MNILLVDDHELILDGLALLFGGLPGVTAVHKATSSRAALALLSAHPVEVAFLDISLGAEDGRDLYKAMQKTQPDVRCIALSSMGQSSVVRATMHLGFDGYLLKTDSPQEIEKALQAVMAGGKYISQSTQQEIIRDHLGHPDTQPTERELEILQLISDGLSSKEIAERLFLAVKTIENHRSNLMAKLDVNNVAGLIKKSISLGYITI